MATLSHSSNELYGIKKKKMNVNCIVKFATFKKRTQTSFDVYTQKLLKVHYKITILIIICAY